MRQGDKGHSMPEDGGRSEPDSIPDILLELRGHRSRRIASNLSGVPEVTIRNLEKGKYLPGLQTLRALLATYHPTIGQILDILELSDELVGDAIGGDTERGRTLLGVFEGVSYCCYFMSADTDELQLFDMGPLVEDRYGRLYAEASTDGYEYDCRVSCGDSGEFAFFTFVSRSSIDDRALLLVPYNRKVKQNFNAGVGALLSLVFPSGGSQYPCFQLVAIVNRDYVEAAGGDAIREVCGEALALPMSMDGYRVEVPELHARSESFYQRLKDIVRPRDAS